MVEIDLGWNGVKAVVSLLAVEHELSFDWSACRSPARARRRHRQGKTQRVRTYYAPTAYMVGDTLLVHPAIYHQLRRELSLSAEAVATSILEKMRKGQS